MATIDDKVMIDRLIANNGHFEDDPQVHMIIEYTNAYGNITWGVTWSNESPERRTRYLDESQYVINPKVIWIREMK